MKSLARAVEIAPRSGTPLEQAIAAVTFAVDVLTRHLQVYVPARMMTMVGPGWEKDIDWREDEKHDEKDLLVWLKVLR